MKEIKEHKNKKKKRKRRGQKIIIALIVLILLFIVFRCSKPEQKVITEYEKNVNAITQIDYSKRQEALNAIVDEGKMNVNYSSEAVFDGTTSVKFNVKNIKNNHYPIVFALYDEEENVIYTSKKIEPGYELNCIQLTQALSKGTHECKLKVGYAQEGNVSSVFPIKIEVR